MSAFRNRLFLAAALAQWVACGCGGAAREVVSNEEASGAEPVPARESEGPLQVEGLLGDIPQYDVERAVQKKNDAIAACYQEALDVSEQIEGSIEIAFDVGEDGSIASAHLRNGTLGSIAAETCILDLAKRLVFPAPRGGTRALVVYPLALEKPYDNPAPADWSGAKAGAVADEHGADVARCLGGRGGVQLTVYVGSRGEVISAGATSDELESAEAASCLAAAARAWKFPSPGPNNAKATLRF